MTNETLIIILFLAVNILTAISISLLDSRNYWRKKWEEDEDYILINIRGKILDKMNELEGENK